MNDLVMPEIRRDLCTLCGDCIAACPEHALRLAEQEIVLDESLCAYCGDCEEICPMGAIALPIDILLPPDQDRES